MGLCPHVISRIYSCFGGVLGHIQEEAPAASASPVAAQRLLPISAAARAKAAELREQRAKAAAEKAEQTKVACDVVITVKQDSPEAAELLKQHTDSKVPLLLLFFVELYVGYSMERVMGGEEKGKLEAKQEALSHFHAGTARFRRPSNKLL